MSYTPNFDVIEGILLEENQTKVFEGVIEHTSVSEPKIIGNKRPRGKKLTEVPSSEEEDLSEEEEGLSEEEKSEEAMADDPVDQKNSGIYIIQIRKARSGVWHGVATRFDSRAIWEEVTRSVNLALARNFESHEVFNKAKDMRAIVRARPLAFNDSLNDAFGHCKGCDNCEGCGNIAQFPRLYPGTSKRHAPSSSRAQANAQASTSQVNADPVPNPTQASITRIFNAVNADQVTTEDGMAAIEWLEKNYNTGGSYFAGLTDPKLILSVRSQDYLRQENAE